MDFHDISYGYSASRAVVLSQWVATQNLAAGNMVMDCKYFIKINLFFTLDEP
jgi:hypothetical protein